MTDGRRGGRLPRLLALALLAVTTPIAGAAEIMLREATRLRFDVHPGSETIVFSALGRLWRMPAAGGTATALTPWGLRLTDPRFAPDGTQLIASGGWTNEQQHLWRIDAATGATEQLTRGAWRDTRPDWHPDGNRIAFVSDRGGSKDIWSMTLADGSTERLSRGPGDETDPVYDNSGTQLIYIEHRDDTYSLRRVRAGMSTETLYATMHRLSSPSVRRDGILISFFEQGGGASLTLKILLPVNEFLAKPLQRSAHFSDQPLRWLDRDTYLVARAGQLLQERLASAGTTPVPFTAWISVPERTTRNLQPAPVDGEAHVPFVLRAQRMVDVRGQRYRNDIDIVVRDGRIEKLVPRQPWPDLLVLDFGAATVVPGLVDTDASAATAVDARWLAAGITTVGGNPQQAELPHPRLVTPPLRLADIADGRQRIDWLRTHAERDQAVITDTLLPDLRFPPVLLSAAALVGGGPVRSDQSLVIDRSGAPILSSLAATLGWPPHVRDTLRNARLWPPGQALAAHAFRQEASLAGFGHLLIPASGGSALANGLGLHAELLALQAQGVSAANLLGGVTERAAVALGYGDLGLIEPGYVADLLLVDGDPLARAEDLLRAVAIVREGRLYSIAGLLNE